ncbi:glutamine synthetase type III, partial [bacterium]|nr:glutamine synthetase type III [bacterium]
MVLNTIVADSLDFMAEKIQAKIKTGTALNSAANEIITDVLKKHQRIIFNGDNYTNEWKQEAEKRGLPNHISTADALSALTEESTYELFGKYNVLNKTEIESRYNVKLEKYILKLEIEFKACLDMASTIILPAAVAGQTKLAESINATKQLLGKEPSGQKEILERITSNIESMIKASDELKAILAKTPKESLVHALYYKDFALAGMNKIRKYADALELLIDDELWPLPKYREMLLLL